jgi:hypothetical protein
VWTAQEPLLPTGPQQAYSKEVSKDPFYNPSTSDLPKSDNTTTAASVGDTAILETQEDPAIASMKLRATVNKIYWKAKMDKTHQDQKKQTQPKAKQMYWLL